MSSLTGLQKLYPHLNFSHIQTAVRSRSEPPPVNPPPVIMSRPEPVLEVKTETKPVIEEKPQTPEPPKEKSPVKQPEKPKERPKKSPKPPAVVIVEPEVETPPPPPKPTGKPKPKGKPLRTDPIPKKGERGLQKKYTLEQRKEMYLEQLSKKSVKRAEMEIQKVNEVLSKVEHSPNRLNKEEKEIKRQLKLINTAKFFIIGDNTNIIDSSESRSETKKNENDSKKDFLYSR